MRRTKKRSNINGIGCRLKFPAQKESEITRTILQYLRLKGIYSWRNHSTGIPLKKGGFRPLQKRGVSDILGILPGGRFLAIEVKTGVYPKATPEQREFLDSINVAGGLAFIAQSAEGVRVRLNYEESCDGKNTAQPDRGIS